MVIYWPKYVVNTQLSYDGPIASTTTSSLREYDQELPLSINDILSFPQCHPVAA